MVTKSLVYLPHIGLHTLIALCCCLFSINMSCATQIILNGHACVKLEYTPCYLAEIGECNGPICFATDKDTVVLMGPSKEMPFRCKGTIDNAIFNCYPLRIGNKYELSGHYVRVGKPPNYEKWFRVQSYKPLPDTIK